MTTLNNNQHCIEIDQLCSSVRSYIMDGDYESGLDMICKSMAGYPDSPQPHNLLAIVLEKTGKHCSALKHFQAALALDPEYQPAKYNLHTKISSYSDGNYAFDESDIPLGSSADIEIVYDSRNVGHVVHVRRAELKTKTKRISLVPDMD